MKMLQMVLLLLVLSISAVAADTPLGGRSDPDPSDLRLLLNSFSALGDGHVEAVLRGLRLISVTEEAKSGEWEKMKGLLAEFEKSGIKAAAVWYARPDGSYYTTEGGLTGQNLRDRQYFPVLMAGKEITGDLVISKSTGRRTAIVAVPIKEQGKVVGALGTSLAVDEISRMLDEKMGLPQNMFFYALDHKGRTSLHRLPALLFAYPSDMGSKSLSKTVAEMLARPSGEVRYDFYGERSVVFRKSPLTGWVFALGIPTGRPGEPGEDLPPILKVLEKEVSAELNRLDRALGKLAKELSERDVSASERRGLLGDLCRAYSYAADCAFIDPNGRLAVIEPAKYAEFEGSDISGQEQVIRLQKTMKPVLSNAFKAVQGIDAASLQHPVFSRKGEFSGSVSILFSPEALFSHVMSPVMQGLPVEAFAMQTDGRILYDADKEEVGRMLFDDPVYKPFPQLIAVGTMAAREKTGSGSYEFKQEGSEKVVRKEAHWATAGLHGTEWRLVVMHVRPGQAGSAASGTDSHAGALRRLAEDDEMKKAISGNDEARVRLMFSNFSAEHPGLYSVQWLDSRGINRCGHPPENSLMNFDMKTSNIPSAKYMLGALAEKKEASFEAPLLEGRTGAFFTVPVYKDDEYLGLIYTIRLKE